jgi:predicted metal-dependent enzyme (double-stranded beta helix superfamily)
MAYALEDFCRESREALRAPEGLTAALPAMERALARLLANEAFVAQAFGGGQDFAKKVLHHDAELGFYVLAHVHGGPKEGPPHSHGSSWAVYGTARGVTGMKEWERVNPVDEPGTVLRVRARYDLGAGQSRAYGPHAIHSTIHPHTAWVIRVTGTNLDELPRYRFSKARDRIVEST